jgi:glutaminyl-peptide cyclotransferase
VEVTDKEGPVKGLNELEYVNGEIFANVWPGDRIVRISPDTGDVTGWIDLTGLLGYYQKNQQIDVLNGIAYDSENDRLFVTGKYWPKLFEIRLIPKKE